MPAYGQRECDLHHISDATNNLKMRLPVATNKKFLRTGGDEYEF